jgi:hypothetical protein
LLKLLLFKIFIGSKIDSFTIVVVVLAKALMSTSWNTLACNEWLKHSLNFLVESPCVDKEMHTGEDRLKHSKAVPGKYFSRPSSALFYGIVEVF